MSNETRGPNAPGPGDSGSTGHSPDKGKRQQGKRPGPRGRPNRQRPGPRQDASPDSNRSAASGARSADTQRITPDKELVVVQFKGHRKAYYNNSRKLPLKVGHYCLVEADRGRDMGRVNYVGPGYADWWASASRQGVVSIAAPEDLARLHENRGDEWEFWDICREKIQSRRLNMSLVTVERQFDHKKITFYFTAEKRVDFRELVRDLAGVFRTRIELRQIGVRDEARLKGGLGICGREFCCSGFLQEFIPVTLKMAKVQQLPLNPGKLSGPCGRLRCCMTYENEVYQDARRRLPRVGSRVTTPQGEGAVRKLDLMRDQVTVEIPGVENLEPWPVAELTWDTAQNLPEPRAKKNKNCPREDRRGGAS
jgi:cell fate regulator YaaT (PSP1 superfamily)